MKIESISEMRAYHIETDEDEYYCYTRYGPDCWYVTMGESDEPFYDCEEIERLFQDKLAGKK